MLLERLRIPSIVGMILAGVCIGPHAFHVLERDSSFELFGKVGLYYIMFLASLEMNMQDVKKIKAKALTLGLLSFAVPFTLGLGTNLLVLGYSMAAAVLLAAMYSSHTLIAYPIVRRYGLSKLLCVSASTGATIVADTIVLLVLAVVGGMFKDNVSGLYWVWLALKVVLLGAAVVFFFPRLGRWFFHRYDDGIAQFIFVLALVFLGAGMMELVGLDGILGAFLVGIVLNRLIPSASPLMSRIEFVGNSIFIPYFLIGVGMIIDVRGLLDLKHTALLAGAMLAVALAGKYLAVWGTQKVFRMSRDERHLMFGLTGARAAATLAVALVGHKIILPDGSPLLDDSILNAAMILILVTCIVSSFVTEKTARRMAMTQNAEQSTATQEHKQILLAVSNPDTAPPLVSLALLMRQHGETPPIAVSITLDEGGDQARSEKSLERAARIAAEANVRLTTYNRWSVNVATGIYHAMMELGTSDLLIGLHEKKKLTEAFYGKLGNDLLTAVQQQIIIYRPAQPLNTVRQIHLLVPQRAEFEPGFQHWADRVAHLTLQIGCRICIYGAHETNAKLRAYWAQRHHSLRSEWNELNSWRDLNAMVHKTRQDHLLVFVTARRTGISYHSYMDRLPNQLERYFSTRGLIILFPGGTQ